MKPRAMAHNRRECPDNCVGMRSRKETHVEDNHRQVG
jgi:hypothetical protein